MTTESQSTTTKLEGSEPTLDPQDMTDEELSAALDFHRAAIQRLSNEGSKIWRLRIRLNDGTPKDKQMLAALHERRNARSANGVPTVDLEAIAKRLDYAAWIGFNQSDSEFEKGYKHAMEVAAQVVRDTAASPVAPDDDKATPLCPVHRRLEDADALECEIGNDCVACSLNERRELLELIAPFAAEGNTEDSVTVLSRVVEFYKAHVGDNRVIVSYPAPAAASEVGPTVNRSDAAALEAENQRLKNAYNSRTQLRMPCRTSMRKAGTTQSQQ